jgi:superfamily II DNA or RNA helicase
LRTYGTCELRDGSWHVKAEPHVAMRLKRLFGRLSTQSQDVLVLKATDEVSRDLEWFCARFPLEVMQPEQLACRSQAHRDDCDAFEKLVSGAAQATHFDLAVPAREYQRVAADLLLRARGLLIADDVGVGKTASAICALTDPRMRPALVVTLAHLPTQWEREIKRFAPKLRTHVLKKATPYDVRAGAKATRQCSLVEPEFPDVIITNYHKLAGWAQALAGVVKSVTFDEVQELRRADSEKSRAAAIIAAQCHFRAGLSATPIYNYGSEFYNVLSVLRPDAMGTRGEFLTEWCIGSDGDKATIKDPAAFGAYLREGGLMLRRTRSDVGRELPALSRVVHHCDADAGALKDAEHAAAELARIILSRDSDWHSRGAATRDMDWRLRQATGLAKAPFVATFVRMLADGGEKVVLYGWHRAVYDLWAEQLADLKPVFFTGEESAAQKQKSFDAFVRGDSNVLILSLRAGAGLDGLQAVCRTVVFGELDWSAGVHEQAIGRVFRDGQPDPVSAYFLVSDEGSDPFVSEVCGIKAAQLDGVRDPNAPLVTQLEANTSAGIKRIAEHYLSTKDRRRMANPATAALAAPQPMQPESP